MAKEPELKARDKVVLRMKREGAVEENLTAGTEQRVSKRQEDAELVKPAETAEPSEGSFCGGTEKGADAPSAASVSDGTRRR